ncbi:hypothetical protein Tco_1543398 [Tanacetum coccineum]
MNGEKLLILDFKTFCEATSLDYNKGTYVFHPSFEARILFTFVIQVLSENYSSAKHVNSIQQLIAYCLLIGTKVDGEIIYSDLITRLTYKSRQKYVSYPRFVSCALEVLLGTEYTQDDKFGSLPNVLSNSNFTKDLSKVIPIEFTASMIAVTNLESSVSPLPFLERKIRQSLRLCLIPNLRNRALRLLEHCLKRGNNPRIKRHPEASGTLPQKRKQPKNQKTPVVQATKTPPTEKMPMEDSDKI